MPARLSYVKGGAPAQLVGMSKLQEFLRTGGMVELVEFLVKFLAKPAPANGYREERHGGQPAAAVSPGEPDWGAAALPSPTFTKLGRMTRPCRV